MPTKWPGAKSWTRYSRNRPAKDYGAESDKWRKQYDSFPYSLAHWRPAKHGKIYADFPAAVAKADECAALRESIKAAPLVPKPPKPKSEKELRKEAAAKTCQICGRPIFAEVGLIAHHGYERPGDGWQTASCMGARELPFEVSRDVLARYIAALENGLAALESGRAAECAERDPITVKWEGDRLPVRDARGNYYAQHSVTFTRSTFDTVTHSTPEAVKHFHESYDAKFCPNIAGMLRSGFDFWKFRELVDYDRRIANQKSELKRQRERFAAWRQTHKWNEARDTWESI